MTEEKKLKTYTIELLGNKIQSVYEDNTGPWWREKLNRQKQGILCPEIMQDMMRIGMNLSEDDGKGRRISKYNAFMMNLSPNPKSSQGKQKMFYKEAVISNLDNRKDELLKFKGKKLLLYIAVYLRKERFERNDLDNFLKAIIDGVTHFIGDDSQIISILTDKKELKDYPKEDLDFLEQVVIVITDPKAKQDLVK